MRRNFSHADACDGKRTARGKTRRASRRGVLILCALLCAALAAGCAGAPKKPSYKKVPPAGKKLPPEQPTPPAQKPPPEMQRTNARPSTTDVVTPKRQASMRLVESGKKLLDSNDYARSAAMFRDAINVDGTNGVAYYQLAVVDARTGQADVALGLLDKAEALLGADEEWMKRIDDLRQELGAAPSKPLGTSPIDQAF